MHSLVTTEHLEVIPEPLSSSLSLLIIGFLTKLILFCCQKERIKMNKPLVSWEAVKNNKPLSDFFKNDDN